MKTKGVKIPSVTMSSNNYSLRKYRLASASNYYLRSDVKTKSVKCISVTSALPVHMCYRLWVLFCAHYRQKLWSVGVACCELRGDGDPGGISSLLVPKRVVQKDFLFTALLFIDITFYPSRNRWKENSVMFPHHFVDSQHKSWDTIEY